MSEPKKKRSPISYRPPEDRWDEFERMVSDSGLSKNAYINEAVFGRSRHRPAEQMFLARILTTCGTISDQLHEISRSGSAEYALLLKQIRDELVRIRTLLMRMLGRRS